MNPHLAQRLLAIRNSLMAHHQGGHGLPNAVIGSERETFLRDFLQKVFPTHHRFSTGAITDSHNHISGQVDIAVEYPLIPSFPMPGADERLILAESVAMVLEVKSNLVAQWDQVRQTTRNVKLLQRNLGVAIALGPTPAVIPCVAIGYTGHNTIDGLINRINETPEADRPDAALVIESGCFVGFGMQAIGPVGLYALCVALNAHLLGLAAARPNLISYVNA